MIFCSRRIHFDAAHRVMGHENKCKHLHGHRFVAEATFVADCLDNIGRIIDFGVIKETIGNWIDENWDHETILHDKDRELGQKISAITGQKVFYLPNNPTAENMAQYLLEEVCPKLFDKLGVKCVSIKLYETPNCFVEARV